MTLTRRALLLAALCLLPAHASADTRIDRVHARADRHCAMLAADLSRHGLTEAERDRLTAANCRQEQGRWVSSLAWGQG